MRVVLRWWGGEGVRCCAEGRKLGWFGHVVRIDEVEMLGKIALIRVPGCQLPGRTRKTWMKNMQEELASLNLQEEQALNRDQWWTVIYHLTL